MRGEREEGERRGEGGKMREVGRTEKREEGERRGEERGKEEREER